MKTKLSELTYFFENALPALLIVIAPPAASFAPAVFLFNNLTNVLTIHPAAALLIAFAAESIGIISVTMFLKIKRFNQKHTAKKHQLTIAPAAIAYIIYITSIVFTNAFLDYEHQPPEIIAAHIFLSLLSLSGALIFAANFAMATTQADIKTAKTEREQEQAKPKRKPAKQTPLTFACSVPGCGFLAKSQNALNAHSRKHVIHKNGSSPKTTVTTQGEQHA